MKRYLCLACGAIRRAPLVLDGPHSPVPNDQAGRYANWPRHCHRPMHRFTNAQYLAARRLPKHLRVPWAASGLHVLLERSHYRRYPDFRAAIWPREVREVHRRAAEEERRQEAVDRRAQERAREAQRQQERVREQWERPPADEVGRWLTWADGTVLALARAIREQGEWNALPVLADALEESGCTDAGLIDICRRGAPEIDCRWVLRVLLGSW